MLILLPSFSTLDSAKARNIDVVLADTAGRLHTTSSLMDQLEKICRVISRVDSSAPHEIMLAVSYTHLTLPTIYSV